MPDTTPSDDFPHWMTHDNSWMKYPCVANRYRRAAKHLRSTHRDHRIYVKSSNDKIVYDIVDSLVSDGLPCSIIYHGVTMAQSHELNWAEVSNMLLHGDHLVEMTKRLMVVKMAFSTVENSFTDSALRHSSTLSDAQNKSMAPMIKEYNSHTNMMWKIFPMVYPEAHTRYKTARREFESVCATNPKTKDHFAAYRSSRDKYFEEVAVFIGPTKELFDSWKGKVNDDYKTTRDNAWGFHQQRMERLKLQTKRAEANVVIEYLYDIMNS